MELKRYFLCVKLCTTDNNSPHVSYLRSETRMYLVTNNISYDNGCTDEEGYRGKKRY